jgi:PAS domain S-box-containing protein
MLPKMDISKGAFEKLFPFYVCLDKDLRIQHSGTSMKKVLGDIDGRHFTDCFKLVRPKLSIQNTFDSFISHQNIVVLAEGINTPVRVRFRGELIQLDDRDEVYYINSPWLNETNDLSYYNLQISDFALHDAITDNIQLLRSKAFVNEDLIKIADELISQRDELVRKNMLIEELARFPDQNPQPILRLDFDGNLLYANDASQKLLKEYDFLNLPFWNATLHQLRSSPSEIIEDEVRVMDKVIKLTFVPIEKRNYFNLYMRDVSDARKYQNDLITSNARLNTLISGMQSGILSEDMDRRIIMVNQQFCDIFRIPLAPEEMIGQDCSQSAEQSKGLFQDEEQFVRRIGEILKNKDIVYGEQLIMKDGKVLERDYIPIFDGGHYKGHIWKYQDITEIIRSKESLQKVEDKYRKVIEALNFGMIEVDMNETITKVYPAFCRLTDYTEEELIGANARTTLAFEEDQRKLADENLKRIDGKGGVYEVKIRTKNGDVKWVIISGSPIFDEYNRVTGSLGIHIDITERKKMEHDLLEANEKAMSSMKAKQLFLANISHELRTPINVVIGMIDLLGTTNMDSEQLRYLQALRSSATNLLTLINDVLDFSKIEAGYVDLRKQELSIQEIIREAEVSFSEVSKSKGVQLSSFVDPLISGSLVGDRLRLSQVLSNLVGNAIKFTETGSVNINVLRKKDSTVRQLIRFEVIDTGIGIAEENREKIFHTFMQEDASISRRYGGTGLGLAICSGIVQAMGGTIGVESEQGKGSTFYFEIPFDKGVDLPKAEELASHGEKPTLSAYRILVAEDNPLNQLLISTILNKEGIPFRLVTNGVEVLSVLETECYDLMLLDIQMPEMDGETAAAEIRKVYGSKTPIVALTANASPEDRDRYLGLGMNEVLTKPFNRTELMDTIEKLILGGTAEERPITFSTDYLLELSSGDAEFIQSILNTFTENTPKYIETLAEAIDKKDLSTIRYIAHQIKPSLEILKVHSSFELALEIERGVDQKSNEDDILAQSKKLIKELIVVVDLIRSRTTG